MGCLARIGCLVLLAVLAVVGWLTRDRWMARLRFTPARVALPAAPPAPVWQPLSDSGAEHTKAALDRLARPTGPVFATLSGGDVASYLFKALAHKLPASTDSIEAAVIGSDVKLRASVRLADFGGAAGLAALGGVLGDRSRLELSGTFIVDRPGLMEFRVDALTIQGMAVPQAAISTLVKSMVHGPRPAGVSDTGMPIEVPRYIGDVRVTNGRITLYKTVE
jgi:hypothetical protein